MTEPTSRQQPLIDIESLSKSFPGQVALNSVSMQILPGQIHALVGQNGSGKSTLIKILAGYHQPDPGAIVRLHGEAVDIGSLNPHERAHLHVMHQDLGLVGSLTIMENLALGRGYQTGFGGRIRWATEAARVRALLAEFDVHADHYIPVEEIRRTDPAQWQAMISGDWEVLGGESAAEFRARVVTAMDAVIAQYRLPAQTVGFGVKGAITWSTTFTAKEGANSVIARTMCRPRHWVRQAPSRRSRPWLAPIHSTCSR